MAGERTVPTLDVHGHARVFVGRTGVLDQLRSSLAEAARGRGRLVVATGEAGIGKTRLSEEAAALAVASGFAVCWAACAEVAGHPAFWPWSQFLAQMGRSFPTPRSPVELVDAEAARLAVFEATVDLLRQESTSSPLLLVLDDLQWADDATVRLLSYVAPVLRSLPVLLVATRRVESGGPDEPPNVSDIERQAVVLRLGGLGPDEIKELVDHATAHPVSRQAADAIHTLTAGNPLFALEVTAQLGTGAALDAFANGDMAEVPRTVRAVQSARLDRVSADCRTALELAAVVGAEFDLGILAEVLGSDAAPLLELMDEAAAAGLVRDVNGGRWNFTHPLLAGTLYEGLGVARRVRSHQRVGLVIESSPGRRDVAALAHHFLAATAAGTADRAVRYSVEAAAAAMATLAYADAARLYERALATLPLAPEAEDRIALLLALAEARAADGLPSSRDALLEAAQQARDEHRPEDLAAVALGLAGGRGFEVDLFDDTQIALLDESLTTLPDDALTLRSLCSSRLSVALSLTDADDRRAELSDTAIDLARDAGDSGALAHALAASCDVHAGPAATSYRLTAAGEIISSARAARDPYAELLGRRLRLVALLESGDLAGAEAEVGRFARTADRLGQAVHGWYVPLWRAMLATARGDLAAARTLADDAEQIGLRAHSTNAELLVFGLKFFMRRESGDSDELIEALEQALPGPAQDLGVIASGTIALARVTAGLPDEAAALLDRIDPEVRDLPEDSEWLPLLVQVAETAWELGGHPTVEWLYDAMLPHGESWTVEGIGAYIHGPASRQLGLLAALLDRPAEARRHFEKALDANRRAGAGLLVARTLWDGGAALGDDSWVRAGLEAYRALGLTRRADQLEESRTPTVPAARPPVTEMAAPSLRQEGDVWVLDFDGGVAHVHDSKGLRDLARLIGAPGQEIAALDLAAGPTVPASRPVEELAVQGDLGEVIDAPARAAYKARLAEIEAELDEVDGRGVPELSERLLVERDALIAQLASAYGLNGRPRRSGDPAERARTAVTARIRDAIRRIEKAHPALGRHLSRSVRTGTFCVYDP